MGITPVLVPWTLLIILSQFLAWRYFLARLQKRCLRILLNFVYIIANILGVYALLSVYVLDFPPPSSFLWDFFTRPGLIWEFAHLVWLLPALLIYLLAALWRFLRREKGGISKLSFMPEKSGRSLWDPEGLCLMAILVLGFYGYAHQLQGPEIERISLSYEKLPEELRGFKIAVLSDFHYGRGLNEEELHKVLDLARAENPDMVVLLGNLVNNKSLLASAFKEPLSKVKEARGGLYAVLGNYDLYTENPHNVTQILSFSGVKVLSAERYNLPELPITVMGFSDPGSPVWSLSPLVFPDQNLPLPWNRLQGPVPPEDNFVILLSDRPSGINSASERGEIDLFLAGRLRGGMIALPWNLKRNLASLFYDHSSGLYEVNGMKVYVTRGLAAPVSPARLFAWPEISLITLEKSPAQPPRPREESESQGT
jgi:predicted MPP superfamily phosphohydrolase